MVAACPSLCVSVCVCTPLSLYVTVCVWVVSCRRRRRRRSSLCIRFARRCCCYCCRGCFCCYSCLSASNFTCPGGHTGCCASAAAAACSAPDCGCCCCYCCCFLCAYSVVRQRARNDINVCSLNTEQAARSTTCFQAKSQSWTRSCSRARPRPQSRARVRVRGRSRCVMCRVLTKQTRDSERERKEREEKRAVGKEHIAGEREKESEERGRERVLCSNSAHILPASPIWRCRSCCSCRGANQLRIFALGLSRVTTSNRIFLLTAFSPILLLLCLRLLLSLLIDLVFLYALVKPVNLMSQASSATRESPLGKKCWVAQTDFTTRKGLKGSMEAKRNL